MNIRNITLASNWKFQLSSKISKSKYIYIYLHFLKLKIYFI